MPTETPGVHVEEIPSRPPSIAEPDSALPAFIGFTAMAVDAAGEPAWGVPVRIASLAEFERHFGGPEVPTLDVQVGRGLGGAYVVGLTLPPAGALLHPSLRLYFENGGGPCRVVSAGAFEVGTSLVDPGSLLAALDAVRGLEEVTLLVLPDAVRCQADGFAAVVRAMLAECAEQRNRFAILDVQRGDAPLAGRAAELDTERAKFGNEQLRYGAAYLPFLRTTYPLPLASDPSGRSGANVVVHGPEPGRSRTLAELEATGDAALATVVRAELGRHPLTLPPSGAVAGVYCDVDRTRGPWKAPANVSLVGVTEPAVSYTDAQQETLNVDAVSGRSLNVIRAFPGRGVRLWGARTLAGNDNDWRYVAVQRLCMHVEQAIVRGTKWVVFERNDAGTWVSVRAAVGHFLTAKWRDGALQGAKPEHAFYVRCGLGQTMTPQDVADGRLVIEIGLAVVRPAEFVVLRIEQRTAS